MQGANIESSESQAKTSKNLLIFLTALTMLNFVALAVLSMFFYSTYTDIKNNSAEISQTNRRIDTLKSDLSKLASEFDKSNVNSEIEKDENEIQPDDIESPYPESGFSHLGDKNTDYGESDFDQTLGLG